MRLGFAPDTAHRWPFIDEVNVRTYGLTPHTLTCTQMRIRIACVCIHMRASGYTSCMRTYILVQVRTACVENRDGDARFRHVETNLGSMGQMKRGRKNLGMRLITVGSSPGWLHW